ncbi:uncharacterized protein [Periplaneta americana]|uniref:uncharacterized protein isoform X4 n=1 Tax=Periplaneta americana TaxID=6978 RepID=UPI0037E8E8D6
MDVIKMEFEADPLDLQPHNDTYKTEEEGNLPHLEMSGMKTECVDQSCDIKSEIKIEDDTPVPFSFPMAKTEVDEDLLDVDRVQKEQKVEVSLEEDEVLSESRSCYGVLLNCLPVEQLVEVNSGPMYACMIWVPVGIWVLGMLWSSLLTETA